MKYTAHINAPQTITEATIKQKHTHKLRFLDSVKISPVCDIIAAPGNFETNIRVEITQWIKYMYKPNVTAACRASQDSKCLIQSNHLLMNESKHDHSTTFLCKKPYMRPKHLSRFWDHWLIGQRNPLTLLLSHFHHSNLMSSTNLSTLISLLSKSFNCLQSIKLSKRFTTALMQCRDNPQPFHYSTPYHTIEAIRQSKNRCNDIPSHTIPFSCFTHELIAFFSLVRDVF